MHFQEFKGKLKDFKVFSVSDIRKVDAQFYPARLTEWQKKGLIKKIRRGYYVFSDLVIREEELFLIANRIYTPSYVSFESALSYYGLIPEGVYTITSACGKKTARFHATVGEFSYRHIKPPLLFGYHLQKLGNQTYKIADREKTVLDYLYLNPSIVSDADFHEWRFNSQEFMKSADMTKMHKYAKAFHSARLMQRLEQFLIKVKK